MSKLDPETSSKLSLFRIDTTWAVLIFRETPLKFIFKTALYKILYTFLNIKRLFLPLSFSENRLTAVRKEEVGGMREEGGRNVFSLCEN